MTPPPPPPGPPHGPYGPPDEPPTDPGGPPPGWSRPEPPRRQSPVLLAVVALLVVLVIILLIALLRRGEAPPSGGPAGPPVSSAPAAPEPTLAVTVRGYRYSLGISAFTPVVRSGSRTAPPGRHFLEAQLVIRNDQTGRNAPALLDSNGAAPYIAVGLAPVDYLPPVHSIGIPREVSDCRNDPRNPDVVTNPDPLYRGITPRTCIVAADVFPTNPVSSSGDDTEMPPGGFTYGTVRTTDLPDPVPVAETTAWLATGSAPSPTGSYAVLDPIR